MPVKQITSPTGRKLLSIEAEYEREHIMHIIRLMGGLPKGDYPDNPENGKIIRILRQSAADLAKDLRKFTNRLKLSETFYDGNFFKHNKIISKLIDNTSYIFNSIIIVLKIN